METAPRRRRSALFVPAANTRALQKAPSTAADVLIFDLEDAVAPAHKAAARENLAAAFEQPIAAETVIRINGTATEWAQDDLTLAARLGPSAILVPKVRGIEDLRLVSEMIGPVAPPLQLWAMIEEPMAFFNLPEICEAGRQLSHRLTCLVVGTNDLALQTGVSQRRYLEPWLMQAILAAKAWTLDILDGVRNDFADLDALQAECRQGADMGFNGKTLIHPAQIASANAAFSPSPEAIEWAGKVVAAFTADPTRDVIAIDGVMVERLHLVQARRILAMTS